MAKVTITSVDEAAVMKLPGVKADLDQRAERVLAKAKADAPVATGEYRDSLHIEEMPDGSFRIGDATGHGIYVEAETGNLARALDAAK